jgi:hypothetical protein
MRTIFFVSTKLFVSILTKYIPLAQLLACPSGRRANVFHKTYGVTTQRWSPDARVHRDERKR